MKNKKAQEAVGMPFGLIIGLVFLAIIIIVAILWYTSLKSDVPDLSGGFGR